MSCVLCDAFCDQNSEEDKSGKQRPLEDAQAIVLKALLPGNSKQGEQDASAYQE
jgi:hypothetical protein